MEKKIEIKLTKREKKIKEILKQYDTKVKAYAVLNDTIELIRKEIRTKY